MMIFTTILQSTLAISNFEPGPIVSREILPADHDMGLVVVSVLICALSNYAALLIINRRRALKATSARRAWSLLAVATISVGVWAMHFTGMLAYSIPTTVSFNATLTVLSILPAAAGTALAYRLSFNRRSGVYSDHLPAFCMCTGMAGMHIIGMEAMHVDGAWMHFDPILLGLSMLVAQSFSFAGIKLYTIGHRFLSGDLIRLGTAIIMSLSFIGMHYIAMMAVEFSVPVGWQHQALPTSSNLLSITIFCITALVFFSIVAVSFMDAKISSYNNALVRSRNRLARSERLLLKAGEMATIAGWEFNDGKINISNQLMTMIPELSPVDPLSFLRTVSSVELDNNQRVILQVRNFDKRLTYPGVEGTRYYRSRCEQINPGQLFGCIQDITEQVNKEQRLKDAKERAEIAAQTRSRFLANMSHELRTPLNGVLGMIPILKDTRLNAEQSEYLDIVQTSGESLLKVINEILDYTKLDHGTLQLESLPFDLESLVHNALTVVSPSASKKGIDLAFDWARNTPIWYVGDGTRLYQIIINILSNAVKFTEHGEVAVSVNSHPYQQLENLEISISDSGVGIPEAQQERIFESFHQADSSTTRKFGGTGLGLSITKNLLEQMNGTIQLSSVEGKGSLFQITIPLPTCTENEQVVLLNGHTFGVMTDDLKLRHAVEQIIEHSEGKHTYIPITKTEELLNINEELGALIVDGDSEKFLAGKEIFENLCKEIPVIILSKLNSYSPLNGAIHLRKPFKPSQLKTEIKNCVSTRENTIDVMQTRNLNNLKARVLVAEDNPINQKIALGMLRKIGVDADCVENGKDALNAVIDRTYDVVLMDMQMPVMDGIDATKRIRNSSPHQPYIIAVTANASDEDRECCLENGMNEHIGKPIQLEKLEESLYRGQNWSSAHSQ